MWEGVGVGVQRRDTYKISETESILFQRLQGVQLFVFSCQGAVGDTGDVGGQGNQGGQGKTGFPGVRGPPGIPGGRGQNGTKGSDGLAGAEGKQVGGWLRSTLDYNV